MTKQTRRNGESVSFKADGHGDLELVQGSLRKLKLADGDVVFVRVASEKSSIVSQVRDAMAVLLEGHKADACLIVAPYNMDLEQIPKDVAAKILRKIVEAP
ncbi:MAG: hypothetical protein ACTSX8_03260 [Alphaproteobacteria bacterium]